MRRIYILNDLDVKGNLSLEGFSKEFIEKHHLKVHYFLTRVLYKYIRRNEIGDGFVPIHIGSVKKVIKPINACTVPKRFRGKSDTVHLHLLIRDLLNKWGVILDYTEQLPDKRLYKCKIKDEWYENGYTLYRGNIPTKLQNAINSVNTPQINDFTGVYKDLFDSLMRVELDEQKAMEWLDNAMKNKIKLRDKQDNFGHWYSRVMDKKTYSYYKMIIENFSTSKFMVVSKNNRVYSSVTNLPSYLRPFLHFNGVFLKEFDISNAQPLLLNYVLETDDLYKELTEKGAFYKYLQTELEFRGVDISDNFKVDFFSKVMFGTNKRKSKEEVCFESCFPISHFSIRLYKHQHGYKALSQLLQKKEAEIMFHQRNGVCSKLINQHGVKNILPIHDAILYLPTDENTVISNMRNCFYN